MNQDEDVIPVHSAIRVEELRTEGPTISNDNRAAANAVKTIKGLQPLWSRRVKFHVSTSPTIDTHGTGVNTLPLPPVLNCSTFGKMDLNVYFKAFRQQHAWT